MLNNHNRAIVLGAGASMREGLWDKPISEMPLWSAIKSECTFGTNSIFEFYTPTVLTFVDYWFHSSHKKRLDKLPLIIGADHPNKKKAPKGDNLTLLPTSGTTYYGRNSFERVLKETENGRRKVMRAGIYNSQLAGIFTLTLAIALGFKEIYLLGFDFGGKGKTHFYQEDDISKQVVGVNVKDKKKVSGIGRDEDGNYKTSCYSNDDPRIYFDAYKEETKRVHIYNVGLKSRINTFEKIDYPTFYRHLENNPEPILHARMRNDIRDFIEERIK